MTVNITDIEWDTSDWDEEEELASGVCVPDLPSEVEDVTIKVDRNEDIDEAIGEWLADTYGYCTEGFSYEVVKED